MSAYILSILDEARRAPSVLNSQPWRFRVCGNTIEVYLEKKPELQEVDPKGRLQVASCGTLLTHLEKEITDRNLTPKVTFFPRLEEPDLVAYVEIIGLGTPICSRHLAGPLEPLDPVSGKNPVADTYDPDVLALLRKRIAALASEKQTDLVFHDESVAHDIQTYLKTVCGQKLKNQFFRESVNLFLRHDEADRDIPFEDELLLSDRFFDGPGPDSPEISGWHTNLLMILTTGTDNRYDWARAGYVLGDISSAVTSRENIGLMSLPVISSEQCRLWLREKLSLSGYPQFILKMRPARPRKHVRKRPLKELLKYGF